MIFICAGAKKTTVNLDLTRHPTLLVKADNGAVILAPRAHVHSSSFSDVGLAGVGFRGTDQNVDAGAAEKKIWPISVQKRNSKTISTYIFWWSQDSKKVMNPSWL